jgi:uncharacterized protein
VIPSRFAAVVPVPSREEVFLFHTLTDAQAIVSTVVYDACFGGTSTSHLDADERRALDDARQTLSDLGFLIASAEDDDRSLEEHFAQIRDDTDELRVTVLTTLRCNLACGYCIQGGHAADASHMSLEQAAHVCAWIESRLDTVRPSRLAVTFFGGEPLLNLPALEHVAAAAHAACVNRGIRFAFDVVTNGLLLSRALVERLAPLGLRTVKVTLDGDAATHDRQRPTPGGHGSFDLIVQNLRAIAGTCRIAIGGNVRADDADGCARLMDRITNEPFAPYLGGISFKPIVPTAATADTGKCSSSGPSMCDSCGLADDRWTWLRQEAARRGLPVPDGLHMGPCDIHRRHSYTVGPDGRLFACPGYAAMPTHAVGHVRRDATHSELAMASRRAALAPWRACGDCCFVPVCAGGCSVAATNVHGDMNAPACHRPALEAALAALARTTLQEARPCP